MKEIIESRIIEQNNKDEIRKCSICGDLIFEDEGNNAEPINNGRCCDRCNIEVVIPARLDKLNQIKEIKNERKNH